MAVKPDAHSRIQISGGREGGAEETGDPEGSDEARFASPVNSPAMHNSSIFTDCMEILVGDGVILRKNKR